MFDIKRGDIVHVKNPIQIGSATHIIQGDHYAVVIQNDKGNEHSGSIIVAYLTSNISRLDLSCNCLIQWYDCLSKPASVILAGQLMTVDREDIDSIIGHLRLEDEMKLNRALRASLALEEV